MAVIRSDPMADRGRSGPVVQDLGSERWELRAEGDVSSAPGGLSALAAAVPGCVHLELIRAGLIPHPDQGLGELDQFWVGRADWEYRCSFEAGAALVEHERLDLVCDGLDTIAVIELNGKIVGRAANMFHPHRFDVRGVLRPGPNEIAITFTSPLRHIRAEEARLGPRPVNGDWDPFNFIRKAACNFGWDWGPKVPTCGIWKPIRLEGWSGVRIAGVRPLVQREGDERWRLDVDVELEWSGGGNPAGMAEVAARIVGDGIDASGSGRAECGAGCARVSMEGLTPRVWWPRGYGEQPLYPLMVSIGDSVVQRRIGFREVRLNTDADSGGAAFAVEINGRPVFCTGANWVPDSLFPTEMTAERYRERVGQAAAARLNMLRVWGGGIYEADAFYRACDEMGLLVWQDFMFACAMYPEEAPYPALVEAEARHQVTRLSTHPSVVLWCGGNETVWGFQRWGWKERLKPGQTWGAGYWTELLPRVMAELDPSRPYWPNTPWSGSLELDTLDPDRGDRHTWDAEFEGYRALVPRFVSEFGRQGPPALATLRRAVGSAGLVVGSRALEHRQRATGGSAKIYQEAMTRWFGPARSFEEWHYLAQVLQARAVGIGVGWARANRPRCMGALVWQLNDCWAGHSWSMVDVDGRKKPAWHALREAATARVMIHEVAGVPVVYAVNDADSAMDVEAVARRMRFDGTVLASAAVRLRAGVRGAAACGNLNELLGAPADAAAEMLVVDGPDRAVWFYGADRELAYPRAEFEVRVDGEAGSQKVTIRAGTLVRDVVIAADVLGGEVDRQLLLLLPGEMAVVEWRGPAVDADEVRGVTRCVNGFGRG